MPLLWQSIILSSVAWLFFALYSLGYCQLYTSKVLNFEPTILGSLWWHTKEYSFWWFITPTLLISYSRLWQKQAYWVFVLCLLAAVMGAAYRIAVVAWEEGAVDIGIGWVNFLPQHLAISLFILLGWGLVMRPFSAGRTTKDEPCSHIHTSTQSIPPQQVLTDNKNTLSDDQLCVLQGNRDIHLPVHKIDCIRAAGNYMEISSEGQQYLLRATLKELEVRLAPHAFLRTHRSYLVNPLSIDRLVGPKELRLKSGERLPIGQKHLVAIKSSIRVGRA